MLNGRYLCFPFCLHSWWTYGLHMWRADCESKTSLLMPFEPYPEVIASGDSTTDNGYPAMNLIASMIHFTMRSHTQACLHPQLLASPSLPLLSYHWYQYLPQRDYATR